MTGPEVPVARGPGEGQVYDMGAPGAVFKADGAETGGRFSVSEGRLAPRCAGPGAPRPEDCDEIVHLLEGEVSVLAGEAWRRLPQGAMAVIPRGVLHDFRNEGLVPAVLLDIRVGGAFEATMPAIVDWFRENPARRLAH